MMRALIALVTIFGFVVACTAPPPNPGGPYCEKVELVWRGGIHQPQCVAWRFDMPRKSPYKKTPASQVAP